MAGHIATLAGQLNPGKWSRDPNSPEETLRTFNEWIEEFDRWIDICDMELSPKQRWALMISTGKEDLKDLVVKQAGVQIKQQDFVQAVPYAPAVAAGPNGNPAAREEVQAVAGREALVPTPWEEGIELCRRAITKYNNVDAAEVYANIDSFSNELLETLLSVLPLRDLMTALLVCKRWNKIGEGPQLWSGINLVVSNLAHMPGILGLSRLTKLKQLTLKEISKEMLEANDNHEVFESIENHEGLKTLNLFRCNVSDMNSDLLARVLTKMENIRLEVTDLNRDQWIAFFNSMSDDTQLKKLEIIRLSLTEANPQSLAEAVSKLEMFELYGSGLTSEQSKAMFKQLAIKSKLKSLKMEMVPLYSVDEPSLVTVLSQLEEAALCSTFLNARQCTAIIGLVAAGNSKLRVLRLNCNDLKYVNPPDIAKAVGNLEIVDLYMTHLTNEQCQEIFKYAQGDSNLKSLSIGCNDLGSVEPASLAKTVSKIEKCSLMCSDLTRPQLEAIFKQLNEDCKLKELDVTGLSLSEVEGDVLSKAVANLVEVDLSGPEGDNLGFTHLTTQQLEALFVEIKTGTKLKILRLLETDLRSVKIDSLVGALGCLEVVHLSWYMLTPEQMDAVKSDECRAKVIM